MQRQKAKELLRKYHLWIPRICLSKSKSLGDEAAAEMDCYGTDFDYKDSEIDWLLLTVLEDLLEENDKLTILNIQVPRTVQGSESFYYSSKLIF